MDKQITTLGFSLKEIYDQIGYTFKSDLLCIAALFRLGRVTIKKLSLGLKIGF